MFHIVDDFEKAIADYFGAPYAVSTDCCTHAIELCLRYKNVQDMYVPKHTYLSVPMTAKKLNINLHWTNEQWSEYYHVGNNIYDAATMWKKDSYIPGSMMCLSFQFRKHLKLGRGGMILLDNAQDRDALIKLGYDGRHRDAPWAEQSLESIGYHYYMTPETAQLGLDKLPDAIATPAETWTWQNYPDISSMLSNIL